MFGLPPPPGGRFISATNASNPPSIRTGALLSVVDENSRSKMMEESVLAAVAVGEVGVDEASYTTTRSYLDRAAKTGCEANVKRWRSLAELRLQTRQAQFEGESAQARRETRSKRQRAHPYSRSRVGSTLIRSTESTAAPA